MAFSESDMSRQLEQLYAYPEVAVVGSLARAAIMGEELSPIKEGGQLRDIDILQMGNSSDQAIWTTGPHHVDGAFNEWFEFGEDTSWLICPYDHRIQAEISNVVLEPQDNTLFGARIRTLDPLTQLHIQYVMGPLRSKDISSVAQFAAHVRARDDLLPDELFEPFVHFSAAVEARRQRRGLRIAESIGGAILTMVPESVKQRTRPLSRRITHGIIRYLSAR